MTSSTTIPGSIFRYGLKICPHIGAAIIGLRAVSGFLPAAESLILKTFFDLLGASPFVLGAGFAFSVVAFSALRVVSSSIGLLSERLQVVYDTTTRMQGSSQISHLLASTPTSERFEDPAAHNSVQLGFDGAERAPGQALGAISNGLESGIAVVSLSFVVVTVGSEFAVLILLAALFQAFFAFWVTGLRTDALVTLTPLERTVGYFRMLLTHPSPVRESRALQVESQFASRFMGAVRTAGEVQVSVERKIFWRSLGSSLAPSAVTAAVLVLTAFRIRANEASVGDLALILSATQSMQSQLAAATEALARYAESRTHYRYFRDIHEMFGANSQMPMSDIKPWNFIGSAPSIACSSLSFAYSETASPVLRNIDLIVDPGETVAIVGRNGDGKSTLMKLFVGLRIPTTGSVLVNGIKLDETNVAGFRNAVAWLPQDFNRFDLTLRDNIVLDRTFEHERFDDVAVALGIDEIATGLHSGYETNLSLLHGNSIGVDLSGGQWQRIALARCLLQESSIIFLDEPTAAFDPEAEVEVLRFLASELRDKTVMLITHRLPVLQLADRVVVVDGGRVVIEGPHHALLTSDENYARMFENQRSALNRLAEVT